MDPWLDQLLRLLRGGQSRDTPLTSLQLMFLVRLARLVGLQNQETIREQLSEDGYGLLRRATYSTYCDCVNAGVGAEARGMLRALKPVGAVSLGERADATVDRFGRRS